MSARFGSRTLISHSEPLFLPQEERDAAQMVSDALARDGVEIHLNSTATKVRMDGGKKIVELLNDGNTATTSVDDILTGIGRRPAVQGLNVEAAGVSYDAQAGIHVDDFLRTSNRRIVAAGDVCLEHQFTNTAAASARIVVRNALFRGRQRMSALIVPWCRPTRPRVQRSDRRRMPMCARVCRLRWSRWRADGCGAEIAAGSQTNRDAAADGEIMREPRAWNSAVATGVARDESAQTGPDQGAHHQGGKRRQLLSCRRRYEVGR